MLLWLDSFGSGYVYKSDAKFSVRPLEATKNNINTIHDLVIKYRRMKMYGITSAVVISSERVHLHNILHQGLNMK